MLLNVDKTKYVEEVNKVNYLEQKDQRMRFNNAQDPIYFAFEMLERRSVVALVGDLIEDTCYEISKAISKVTK
jgi:hypothetical protein